MEEIQEDPVIATQDDPITTTATTTESAENADTCASAQCSYIYGAIAAVIAIIIIVAVLAKGKSGSAKNQGKQSKSNGAPRPAGAPGKLVEIYVGNLNYDVDDAILLKQFTKFGVIKSARVVINRHNNKSKGYGFVEMPHREEAEIAIKKLNNHDLMGRPMKVNEARRDSRPFDKR
ncbi:MAG: RNA-binding protein [Kiritimatiellaeota bacterium]|nr:RNA-binding protein [Kiritimatiellota bacterium]